MDRADDAANEILGQIQSLLLFPTNYNDEEQEEEHNNRTAAAFLVPARNRKRRYLRSNFLHSSVVREYEHHQLQWQNFLER